MNEPKIDQCYFCKEWFLEERLSPVSIPDQGGRIAKSICPICLKRVVNRKGIGLEPGVRVKKIL